MRVKRRNDPQVRAFWSQHVAAWMRSPFNQREYCERHGISRTLLQKWRVWLSEDRVREERIKIAQGRRRRRVSPMTYDDAGHRTKPELTTISRTWRSASFAAGGGSAMTRSAISSIWPTNPDHRCRTWLSATTWR